MNMINRIFDSLIDGSLLGVIEDTPEVKKAGKQMEDLMYATIPKEKQRDASETMASWEYSIKKQAFEIGFKCAMSLFTNTDIKTGGL